MVRPPLRIALQKTNESPGRRRLGPRLGDPCHRGPPDLFEARPTISSPQELAGGRRSKCDSGPPPLFSKGAERRVKIFPDSALSCLYEGPAATRLLRSPPSPASTPLSNRPPGKKKKTGSPPWGQIHYGDNRVRNPCRRGLPFPVSYFPDVGRVLAPCNSRPYRSPSAENRVCLFLGIPGPRVFLTLGTRGTHPDRTLRPSISALVRTRIEWRFRALRLVSP